MTRFFAELKRRNVYKVAVAYAVVGWLLMQAASILFPTFEAPSWVMKVFVAIIVLGFPIALIIAWAFEMTPQGMVRTEDVPPGEFIPQWSRRKFAALVISIAAVAAALLVFQLLRGDRQSSASAAKEKSIAVLPFDYLSEDKTNAYFADGIQDEILTRLSTIADLKVISRTSTQKYKSAPANLRDIAQQLGVAHVLEGSVQKAADQVRVTVQLINAINDAHLWAQTYDRKFVDVFQVESDVAEKIASTLEAKLSGKEKAAIESHGTNNPQAYETFLRALALRQSQSNTDSARMRDLLREAVQLDPNFADAWAWLASAESSLYFFPEESPAQKQRAREAADTALRLAPESADGVGAMGLYYYYVEKNYAEALRWLDRAHSAAPNDWRFIGAMALVLRRQGKLDDAIALQKRGAELDPLNPTIWAELAWSYRGRRELEQCRAMLDRALAVSPNDVNIVAAKAESYAAAGDLETSWRLVRDIKFAPADDGFGTLVFIIVLRRDYDELTRRLEAVRPAEPPLFHAVDRALLGRVALARGDRAAAEPLLRQAERELMQLHERREGGALVIEQLLQVEACLGQRDQLERLAQEERAVRQIDAWTLPAADESVARAYATLGDADRAIPLLQKVLHETYAGALTPAYLRNDPDYDRMRNDPRFQKLVNEKL